jgi:hypothetical protein
MAEATGLRQSLPYPVYGAPFGFVIPITEADGDLVTSAAGLDSEISKNGDTLTDCTNEATEIGGGLYYLLLTATEMTADVVSGVTKTSTADAKTTSWSLYPRKLVTVRSGTAAGGDTGYITLDAAASAVDDYYNGLVCIATIDSTVEARIITDYTGSSKQAAVTPAWNTAPDNDDTFIIKLPEGVQLPTVPSAADNATAAAAAILVTPANKLATDASGHVSISGTKNTLDDLADFDPASDTVTVGGLNAAALADFFDTDSTKEYADAVDGSVVKEIADIAGGTIAISATQAASVSTGALAIRTHHTLSQAITSTTTSDLSAATKLWLTVKSRRTDTDAQAVVFIEETAGLTVLAGAAYTTVAHGTLVVGGVAGAWTVTVGLDEVATGLLKDYAESMLWAECKALVGGSTVAVWDGVCDVSHGLVVAVA